ncbi:hypothetical protein KDK95_09875 [Actinospica sp. MGRD01-02]|uniref:Uncharacterized protein n=1 Tax=Actinospica acidithermotolerans TaxID=2828514 RepID=A0A941EA22_9ACTN|nr:hypothetical protein [Actinospica acidithermotolerans]MBR7826612.1 hypothetical protein [Actinospica acidithermotolerans]
MSDGSYNYANLVIDYSLLNQAATDISALSPEISKIKGAAHAVYRGGETYSVPGQNNDNNAELGPYEGGLYGAMGRFYGRWATDMSNAMDSLNKMAGYFKGVADSFMETDASQAAGLNMSAAMSAVLRYPMALDQWYTDQANAAKEGVAFTEPEPTAPSSPFSLAGSNNNVTTTYTTQTDTNVPDADKSSHTTNEVFASETTTVTVNGMTYKETTTFQADQGWGTNGSPTQNTTQVINNPDGSTDTITTTTNTSGAGNMTDVNSDGTTTTYTRADWNSPWVDTSPTDTSSSTSSGPDAAPFVD